MDVLFFEGANKTVRFTRMMSNEVNMGQVRRASTFAILLQAALLVSAVRLALWTVPFRFLRRGVAALTRRLPRNPHRLTVAQLSWAVCRVSPFVPRATCLTQALALHVLVRRAGLHSRVCVGVAKQGVQLESHAWVESQGKVWLGGNQVDHYSTIVAFD